MKEKITIEGHGFHGDFKATFYAARSLEGFLKINADQADKLRSAACGLSGCECGAHTRGALRVSNKSGLLGDYRLIHHTDAQWVLAAY